MWSRFISASRITRARLRQGSTWNTVAPCRLLSTTPPIPSSITSTPTPTTASIPKPTSASSPRRKHHWFRRTLGVLSVVAVGTGIYVYSDDERHQRVTRAYTFWTRAAPIYAHYRYVEWKTKNKSEEEQNAALEELHEKYAPICLELLLHLRGFYIKLGQVGSTRADFVPASYVERMTTLQDGVPQESGEWARRAVEKSLGRPIDQMFSYFNDKAIGAASISQVHEARLLDGTEVVVKIQYEKTKRLFELDLATVRAFCKIAQPVHLSMLDEIQKQFMTEFDFEREANHLIAIRANMLESFPEVVIPTPIPGMVTKDVLVMERLHGIKLVDGLKQQLKVMAEKQGKTIDQLRSEFEEAAQKLTLHSKKPSAFTMTIYQYAMKLRNITISWLATIYNYTAGWVLPNIQPKPVMVPINHVAILDLLLRVHGHQILVNGLFNGDPHPGNVLLLDNGKLGLIDYGQVKALTREQRIELSKLVVYLATGAHEQTVEQWIKMGMKTRDMNPWVIEKHAEIAFNRDDRELCGGLNLQLMLEHLNSIDPSLKLPDEYIMAARVAVLLRGLGTILLYPHATTRYWLPIAERVLREEHVSITPIPTAPLQLVQKT